MARAAPPAPLELLAARFRERILRARRQLGLALLLLGLLAGALLARNGTTLTRLGGALLLLSGAFALAAVVKRGRRTLRERRRLLQATLLQAAPEVGAKALRALSLLERAGSGSPESLESPDLARLHFQRVLALVPAAVIERWTARKADRTRLLVLAVVVASGTALALDPSRVLEGLNVLVARNGRAPIPMFWLGQLSVEAQPPAYLRRGERSLFPTGVAYEPAGSVISFHGIPEREGRVLVLVGNGREVPFVSDGGGGMAARWVLNESVQLSVAARFGGVLIPEPERLELRLVADVAPRVELEGAPRSLSLKDLQALELRYDVSDDHGLREIALVLRSGSREDRRTLERLDGEAKSHSGAQALSPRDGFLRRTFLPVEVFIEARDNDGVSGAKWGASQPIVLIPAGVGEGEVARFAALSAARKALVDALARSMAGAAGAGGDSRAPRSAEVERKEQRELVKQALVPLQSFVSATHAGLPVSRPLQSFLLGQARSLERPAATRETFLRRLEDVLLAVDAALRATGDRDAETVAKRLGDVAEEVADASRLGQESEQRKAASLRLGAALPVLQRGADALLGLSELGADLGGVAHGETRRIQRALGAKSYLEAELAARHLAARLRRPKPSFSSAGGGGVESGGAEGGSGGPAPPGEVSQAHRQFQELLRELAQLSAEHAGEVAAVESALQAAEQGSEDVELQAQAKARAEALRQAFERLPDYAPGQTPAEQAAALAREHGRAMAESVARLGLSASGFAQRVKEAKQSAASAKGQLGGARQAPGSAGVSSEALNQAEAELDRQLAWLDELAQKAQGSTDARSKDAMEQAGKREQSFAERAQNLSGRGSHGEAALPSEVAEALDRAEGLMREAARELQLGRGERGLELQREAQRWLDRDSDDGKADKGDESEQDGQESEAEQKDGNGGRMRTDAGVPGKDKNRRADDFRERVLKGLSRDKGGRLSPAVKRYAEGLLQ